jgi:hypothetical protein
VVIARGDGFWGGGAWWSPDGGQLALRRFDVAAQSFVDGLWIVNVDGESLRRVTTMKLTVVGGWQPTW